MSIIVTILIFSILIVVHEFGHFLAARHSGIRVEKFAIGFGPVLLKWKSKETDFMICAFPLGGFVKLAGDSRAECKGNDDEFLNKSPGIKMKVVIAGPLFNYILAFVIFCIIAFIGFPFQDTIVGNVLEGYPAQSAGLKVGDKIIEVNGLAVDNWSEMTKTIRKSKKEITLKLVRNDKEIFLNVPLKEKEVLDDFGIKKKAPIIGISPSPSIKMVRYGFPQAILKGGETLFILTYRVIKGLMYMITGSISFKEGAGGPIAIFYITSEFVKIGLVAVLQLMAALNVSLAIINLFPVPILDGGHLLFFFLEKIRKKSLSEKTEEVLSRIGFAMIGVLIVFVFYNDIVKYGPRIKDKIFNKETVTEIK